MNVVGLKVFFQHPALLLPESSNSCGPPAKPGVYPREIIFACPAAVHPVFAMADR